MTRRRGHGEGGVDARGGNSWRLRYRVNGRRFTKTMHGTKTEAQKALRNLLHTSDTGAHVTFERLRFHDLRGTHATLLLNAGVPAHVVAERCGHDTAVLWSNYAKMTKSANTSAADVIGSLTKGALA